MRRRRLIGFGWLLSVLAIPAALACDGASKPYSQSISRFYDSGAYGRLGVKGLGENLHILDEYRCYDLYFLRNKLLSIYFNNATMEEGEPTYLGATIVRSFSGKESGEGAFSAYVYRNASAKSGGGNSKWARPVNEQVVLEQGASGSATDFNISEDKYAPDTPMTRASNFEELMRQSLLAASPPSVQLKTWHALVVSPDGDQFRVKHNTSQNDGAWSIDSGIGEGGPPSSYLIVRKYLIKYQNSQRPRREAFFQVGAGDADCVYIRLVAPGDAVKDFAIKGLGASRGFITLKMKSRAICRAPA